MEVISSLSNSTTDRSSSDTTVAAGANAPRVLSQPCNDEIQTNGSNTRANAHSPRQSRATRYGLPCASCRAYYASDLTACPICSCTERVHATGTGTESATFKRPVRTVLPYALRSLIDLDLPSAHRENRRLRGRCDEQGQRLLVEYKLLAPANTDEAEASTRSPCILDQNHDVQRESASVCLNWYEQLGAKLTLAEAALLMDLDEAAQIIYEAVWADPAPTEPSTTYRNAAKALLNEVRYRAVMVRLGD